MCTGRPLLLLALLLSGCALGPDFIPPQPDTPTGWTQDALRPGARADKQSRASTGPITDAWWASFSDPPLTSLIARASSAGEFGSEAGNAAHCRGARARDITGSAQFPMLDANGGYMRERISERTAFTSLLSNIGATHGGPSSTPTPIGGVPSAIPSLTNPFDQYQWGFDASWEIDLFGRVRRSVKRPMRRRKPRSRTATTCCVSLQGDVARAYIDLRAAQLRRSVLDDDLKSQREILDLTRDRARFGIGNHVDVANAAAQVTSTEALLPQATAQISQDINQLSLLLALPPGALRGELDSAKPVPPVPPEVPVGLPADLARRRPDIRRAEAQLHAATAEIGVAVADLFPPADAQRRCRHSGLALRRSFELGRPLLLAGAEPRDSDLLRRRASSQCAPARYEGAGSGGRLCGHCPFRTA